MRLRDTISTAALTLSLRPPSFAGADEPAQNPGAEKTADAAAAAAAAQPAAAAADKAPAVPAASAAEPAPDQAGHMAQPSLIEGAAPAPAAKPDGAPAAPDKPADGAAAAAPGEAAAPGAKPETKPDAAAAKPDAAAKPAEAAKPADAAKPDAAAKPAEPAPAPVTLKVEDVKLPEGFKAEGDTLPSFVAILNDGARAPGERAQALVDLHVSLMKNYRDAFAQELAADQHRVFGDTRQSWQKQIMADPILGGAGHQTAMGAIARMRDTLVPANLRAPRVWDKASAETALKGQPPEKIAGLIGRPRLSAWDEFLRVTGAGDHPVFAHLLHEAARYLDEPAPPPTGARPPADIGRRPRNAAGRGSRRDVLYDHPSSQRRS
jgi:hypothetical protein